MLDRKTAEKVHFLFAVRAGRISKNYINDTIIPALCRKAGVPPADVRGPITSHRRPLHHRHPALQRQGADDAVRVAGLAWAPKPGSTQHYAKITPTTLARAYSDASYFARNVRTIEVLVDRDAAASGAAADGNPGSITISATASAATTTSTKNEEKPSAKRRKPARIRPKTTTCLAPPAKAH